MAASPRADKWSADKKSFFTSPRQPATSAEAWCSVRFEGGGPRGGNPHGVLIDSRFRRSGFMSARKRNFERDQAEADREQAEADALKPPEPPAPPAPPPDVPFPDAKTVRAWVQSVTHPSVAFSPRGSAVRLTDVHKAKVAAALHSDMICSGGGGADGSVHAGA